MLLDGFKVTPILNAGVENIANPTRILQFLLMLIIDGGKTILIQNFCLMLLAQVDTTFFQIGIFIFQIIVQVSNVPITTNQVHNNSPFFLYYFVDGLQQLFSEDSYIDFFGIIFIVASTHPSSHDDHPNF